MGLCPQVSDARGMGARAACGIWVPPGFTAWTTTAEDHCEQCPCLVPAAACTVLSSKSSSALALAGAVVGLSLGQQRRCCCTERLFLHRPEQVYLPLQQALRLCLQQPSESSSTAVLIPTREGICAMHREIVFTATLAVTSLKYLDMDPSKQSATSWQSCRADQNGEVSRSSSMGPTTDLKVSRFASRFQPSHTENYHRDH